MREDLLYDYYNLGLQRVIQEASEVIIGAAEVQLAEIAPASEKIEFNSETACIIRFLSELNDFEHAIRDVQNYYKESVKDYLVIKLPSHTPYIVNLVQLTHEAASVIHAVTKLQRFRETATDHITKTRYDNVQTLWDIFSQILITMNIVRETYDVVGLRVPMPEISIVKLKKIAQPSSTQNK